MRLTAVAAAALTLALAPLAWADAFVLPHVLETSGSVAPAAGGPGTTFTFDTTIFATYGVNVTGPDATGRYDFFAYAEPLSFTFTDTGGSEIVFDLLISSASSRPEGAGYRTSLTVQPVWRSYGVVTINAAGAAYDVTSVHFPPDPIAPAGLLDGTYALQAMQLAGFDDRGRDIVLNLDGGTLTIPAPAGAALFAAAGLLAATRRRRSR